MCCGLELHGHLCAAQTNARAALDIARTFQPEIVIYEWSLRPTPMLGFAAAVRANASATAHSLLVIVASALDEPDGFSASEGVDAYFTKPVLADDLERAFSLDLTHHMRGTGNEVPPQG